MAQSHPLFDAYVVVNLVDGSAPLRPNLVLSHCFPEESKSSLPKNLSEFCMPDLRNIKRKSEMEW
jgi:hypothetical protein